MTRVCRLCGVWAKLWIHWLLGGAQFPVSVWWAPLLERTLGVRSGGAGQGSSGTTVSSGRVRARLLQPGLTHGGVGGVADPCSQGRLGAEPGDGIQGLMEEGKRGKQVGKGKIGEEKTLRGKVSEKGEGEGGGSG